MKAFVTGTSASTNRDTELAVREAWAKLVAKVPEPSLVLLSTTVEYDLAVVHRTLAELATGVPFLGGTSCGGVMTDEGFFGVDGRALAFFAVSDETGDYGVGAAPLGDDPREAARRAVKAALADADCEGQLPSAVWMVTTPGGEEQVVLGIADVVGDDVPLVGGSAADNTLEGKWRQIVPAGVLEGYVCVAALFPSVGVGVETSFHSGYDPTPKTGTVTRAERRVVYEIDGKPAAGVYNEWTGGAIDGVVAAGGGELLSKTNLFPIGRHAAVVHGVPYFVLSHPERAFADGSMGLFTDVAAGDAVVCMSGSVDNLVARAGNVARAALSLANVSTDRAHAALIIFCGGCYLTVRERIEEVHKNLVQALGGVPFFVTFTFGEQGRIVGVGNRHGNLMIATLAFVDEPV